MKFVEPKTFLIGATGILDGLKEYLEYSGNTEFLDDMDKAREQGLSDGQIICSFYAKLCYKSLTLGQNQNVSRIRDVESNLMGCFNAGHGSVFEHCNLNFVTTDCSRVFTHELVRHRVGSAFSQTSGRYVSTKELDLVLDPILDPVKDDVQEIIEYLEKKMGDIREKLDVDNQKFSLKKKLTSAIRRIAPNGQSNEIGWSVNIRSLRHTILMRTSSHAEWEIRKIFNQVGEIIESEYPLMLYGLEKKETGDGLFEWVNSETT